VTYTQLSSNFSTPELSARLHLAAACAARVPAHIQHNRGDMTASVCIVHYPIS
jgi:hypothetical protein